ncbi:MAG: hypothetical protein ACJAWI_001899 [Marinomonas primoryensis]|jgi:hypothetical protein
MSNINATPPININSITFNAEDAKNVSGAASGTRNALFNETNITIPSEEKEPDPKTLTADKITIQIIGYNPKGFLDTQAKNSQSATDMLNSYMNNIVQSKKAKELHSQISESIAKEHPELADKKWDFSLNSNNDITILHNGDLSDEEANYLWEKIQYSALKETLVGIKDSMITLVKSERGADNYSTKIGRFDISDKNFDQIIHFGDFLNKTNGEDANQVFTAQLKARADDPYKNLTYEYLVDNEHLTVIKPIAYSPQNK